MTASTSEVKAVLKAITKKMDKEAADYTGQHIAMSLYGLQWITASRLLFLNFNFSSFLLLYRLILFYPFYLISFWPVSFLLLSFVILNIKAFLVLYFNISNCLLFIMTLNLIYLKSSLFVCIALTVRKWSI